MSCRTTRSAVPSITTRPSAEEKERFASLAAARGLSESALALNAIRAVIGADSSALHSHPSSGPVAATDRLTIRLRPGDGQMVARRAEQRGMRVSAYVAAMVRAHLVACPLVPANELAALKESVGVLATLGRLMAQVAKTSFGIPREELERTRVALAALEQRTHELARAALISWETRSA